MPPDNVDTGASGLPDGLLLLESATLAAVVAGVMFILCALLRKRRGTAGSACGGPFGVAFAALASSWLLGLAPHFPPREDMDRLLLVLLPLAAGVETAAPLLGRWAWLLRGLLAFMAAPIVLHGSSYLVDLAGPGTSWSLSDQVLILGGLGASLACTWWLLVRLAQKPPGRAVLVALGLTCFATALTIMLSGYATGGQLGVPLGAAILGALVTSFLAGSAVDPTNIIGVGLVGLSGLLVAGRFFGELSTVHAALLLGAPLVLWLAEGPPVKKISLRLRVPAALIAAAIPLALAVALAASKSTADSRPRGDVEPSIQDYMEFGK